MTDEVTTAAQEQAPSQTQTEGIVANQPGAAAPANAHHGGDPNVAAASEPAAGMSVEEVEAKRREENLDRAKANGYVEPPAPSIAERVNVLVAGVEASMAHNSPISIEHLAEMKVLLGYRGAEPAQGDEAPKAG